MFNITKKIKKYQIVRRDDITKKLFFTGVVTGLIGSISAFLTTRKNGEQNRKEIVKTSQKLGNEAKKNLERFGDFSSGLRNTIYSEASHELSNVKNKVRDELSSVKNKVGEIAGKTREVTKEVISNVTGGKNHGKEIIEVDLEKNTKD